MDHPQTFLLKKIIGYKENGLSSLGELNGKHVDDIADVMRQFAEGTMIELVDRINKGETVFINDTTGVTLTRKKSTHGKRAKQE